MARLRSAVLALFPVLLVALQFCADKFQWAYRPSYGLQWVARHAIDVADRAGRLWALVSSYLAWLRWEDVKESIMNLATPIADMFTGVPTAFFGSYWEYACSFGSNAPLVAVGSAVLLIFIAALCAYHQTLCAMHRKRPEHPLRGLAMTPELASSARGRALIEQWKRHLAANPEDESVQPS
jgi:hypothetical protein